MSLYAIEKREPGGEWEIHTYAPSTDLKKIADGLPACAKNADKEWRVSTFVRVDETTRFVLEFKVPGHGWRVWEPDGYPTRDMAESDMVEVRRCYPHATARVVAHHCTRFDLGGA